MRFFLIKEGMIKGGGVGTLYICLAEQCKFENIECSVISSQCSDTLIMDFNKRNIHVDVIPSTDSFRDNAVKIINSIIDETRIIVTEYSEYLYFLLKYKNKGGVQIILYIVNPYALYSYNQYTLKARLAFIKNRILRKGIIKQGLSNNCIYIMDKDCAQRISEYYHLDLTLCKNAIRHLPFKSTVIDLQLIEKRNKERNKNFEILTIARADFPYKGYLVGLLHEMTSILDKYPHVNLKIISYGSDYKVLLEETDKLPTKIKQHINLISGVPRDKLKDYYYSAHLYIGMGTTVLEAANYKLPVILAQYSTMAMLSKGFFSNYYNDIATRNNGKSILGLVDKIVECDDFEYIYECDKSKEALLKAYNPEEIISAFKQDSKLAYYPNSLISVMIMKLDLKLIDLTQVKGGL